MKIGCLLLVAVFAGTLSLSSLSAEAYGASKEGVTAPTDTAKMTKAATGDKGVSKVTKEIPHDVNINTAENELLTPLPGIGPVAAETILQYRKDDGQFKSIDELTKVKGFGDKTLAKLKPYLYNRMSMVNLCVVSL